RLEHAIDVLAEIEMRTLYFDLAWLAREARSGSLDAEFVVRVSRLLHEAILALFDGRNSPERTGLLVRLAMLELHHAEDSTTFIPLPREPRCRRAADIVLGDPTASHEIEDIGARSRDLGADAAAAVLVADAIKLQELVPARPHCRCDRKAVDPGQCLGQATGRRPRLCQRAGVLARIPPGYRQDADGVCGSDIGPNWRVSLRAAAVVACEREGGRSSKRRRLWLLDAPPSQACRFLSEGMAF